MAQQEEPPTNEAIPQEEHLDHRKTQVQNESLIKKSFQKWKSKTEKVEETTVETGHDEPWESSLDLGELILLEELGLGVAVDITVKHPWVKKSALQAKPVAKAEKDDLIVINESNQFLKTSEHVETYSEIQAGLESSFRPDPSKPISVNIAADFHRSNTRSKTIKGTTVLTRTIAFRVKHPSSRREKFEAELHKWLVKRSKETLVNCSSCKNKVDDDGNPSQCPECEYSQKTNHYCIDYLKELGGVTHYVSSITLGATKYHITQNSNLFQSLSTTSGLGVDSFVKASTKSKVSRKVFQSSSKEQRIGKIPQDDSASRKELLKFRTKGEAVVRCSYNSLANLVSHPSLRKKLEKGIQEYIDSQKNGTRGPYHIGTAEKIKNERTKERKRLYWKVCPDKDFKIECTSNSEKASNFYLKPIVRQIGKEKYFYIATDPEDNRGYKNTEAPETKAGDAEDDQGSEPQKSKSRQDVNDPKEVQSALAPDSKASITEIAQESKSQETESWQCVDDHEKVHEKISQASQTIATTDATLELEPIRYVTIDKHKDLRAELVKKHKGKSAFKLNNPQDKMTYPLSKSQWLPEASLGSQPYGLCREGLSFTSRKKVKSVCVSERERKEDKDKSKDEDDIKNDDLYSVIFNKGRLDSHRIFILQPGHKS